MDDGYTFPFVDDDSVYALMDRKRKNRTLKNLTKMMQETKQTKEEATDDRSYYKGTRSSVAPPDEPLNILMIHHASIYKVDGSNTIEPVDGLESFKDGYVLGSFNGLVALNRCPGDFYLLNPNTGKGNLVKVNFEKWKNNLRWHFKYYIFGLCHDSGSDEYKAVIFDSMDRCFTVVNFKHKERSVCKTQLTLPNFKAFPSGPIGTVVKGVPYWICKVSVGCLIYYFDSKTEKFLMGPDLPQPHCTCRLGTLDGKLIASHEVPHIGTEFWALDDGGYIWRRLFVFPELMCSFSPLSWMTCQVELLVHDSDNRLIVYNVRDQSVQLLSKRLQIMMNEGFRHDTHACIVPYISSLIDPF